MIAACVKCGTEFLHASQGRLFYYRRGPQQGPPSAQPAAEVEFYWLCENCAATHTLKLSADGVVRVIPSEKTGKAGDDLNAGASSSEACPNCSALALAND